MICDSRFVTTCWPPREKWPLNFYQPWTSKFCELYFWMFRFQCRFHRVRLTHLHLRTTMTPQLNNLFVTNLHKRCKHSIAHYGTKKCLTLIFPIHFVVSPWTFWGDMAPLAIHLHMIARVPELCSFVCLSIVSSETVLSDFGRDSCARPLCDR